MFKPVSIAFCLALLGGTVMAQDIEMVIGEQTYTVTLNDNDAAKNLPARLPMTITFENFGRYERIAYLKPGLTIGKAPCSTNPKTGDLTYYIPWGNLAACVADFRESDELVPLGKMGNEAINALKASGDQPVTLRVKK